MPKTSSRAAALEARKQSLLLQHQQIQKEIEHELQQNKELQLHSSLRTVSVSYAQLDAYHPIEDKLYFNEREKLYAIFDGHGGDILFF